MRRHYREARSLKKGERLRDLVFGYNDGAVTTLAILTALVTSSIVEGGVVLLGAVASILGSSISLMFSDYISIKSQVEVMRNFTSNKRLSRHEKEEAQDILKQMDHPLKIAGSTAMSFVGAGLIAMSPFLFMSGVWALVASIAITFASVFFVGLVRARYTHGNMMKSGAEMLAIAAIALLASYFLGTYGLSLIGAV